MSQSHSHPSSQSNSQAVGNEVLALFSPLNAMMPDHLQALAETMTQQWLFAGDTLFQSGQCDSYVYYLLYGQVECCLDNGEVQLLDACATLAPLGNLQPRPFTLVAAADCSVIRFDREHLDKLLTWSQTAEYLLADIAANRDLDEDAQWLSTLLRSNLFLKVPPANMAKLFDDMYSLVVYQGDVIIRQGEYGDRCYFIKEGKAQVSRRNQSAGCWEPVAAIGPGRCFGEDALVQQTVRNANVTMDSNGVLMVLEKERFLELLREDPVAALPWSEWQQSAAEALVIDVRTESEYSAGHLPRAVNVPLSLLSLKLRLIPQDHSVLLYCDSGRRSRTAARFLMEQGIGALCLKDGLAVLSADIHDREMTTQDFVLRSGRVVMGQGDQGRDC